MKHRADGHVWEIGVGAETSAKFGWHGAMPTGQRAGADQFVTTDLASVITLANELRAALVEKGVIKGGV